MISLEASPSLLGISLLGILTIVCLLLFWMLRQQKFLHELFRTLHELERRNREAQRDLFLILRSYLGFRNIPISGQVEGASPENYPVPRHKEPETREGNQGLSFEEVRLLVALATRDQSEPESLTGILKSVKDFNDLEAKLGSLRDKGFIFYSDLSDVVVLMPKVHHYLRKRSEHESA